MVASAPTTEPTLTYELKNQRPVELLDLAASLMALGDEFCRFTRQHGSDLDGNNVRLYIKEVRAGSIIAELISLVRQYSLISTDTAWVVQFADYLRSVYEIFKGGAEAPLTFEALKLDKSEYDRLSQIVEPAAKDGAAQLNLVAHSGGIINVNLSIDSTQANAIQNRIRRERDALPAQITGIHHDQVLYWYQVRDDTADKPGDRAIIPRIYSRPVKVQFANDTVKIAMIDRPDNPFRLFYIVDVDVTEIEGKPVLYRIVDVKGTMERES